MAQKNTSITLSKVDTFKRTAVLKDRLQCSMIKGFHLYMNTNGAVYRIRYRDLAGKVKNKVLGRVSEIKPTQAAEIALDIIISKKDPLLEKVINKKQFVESQHLLEQRNLGNYLKGLYSQHQARKRSGNETINMIRKNFGHLFDRDMSSLSTADIKSWQLMREQEIAFSTIQRAYGALKTMLFKAVDDGIIEACPLPAKSPLERPHFEEIDKKLDVQNKRRILTSKEVQKLFKGIEAYNTHLKSQRTSSIRHGKKYLEPLDNKRFAHWSIPFTFLAYYSGIRTGDLKSLSWQNLNLQFKRLHFTPNKTRHHPDPVTVTLDLPDSVINLMRDWKKQQRDNPAGLVFPSDITGKPFDKHAHIKHWKKILDFAELDSSLDFYSLRHHWISTLIQTENLLQVARMAGHKSTKMIEKHYGHLITDQAKGALKAFDIEISQPQHQTNNQA